MSVERGIVIANSVIDGTDWCLRDPAAWWSGGRGTRMRAAKIDLLVGHWTAGEAGAKSYSDDGPHIYRVMRNRLKDGRPLNVGIHFVIGACDREDEYAPVWQTMDPGFHAAVHVGEGRINARSIGVEVVSAGLPGPANVRDRVKINVPLLGRIRPVLAFFPGQVRSWVRLAEALASLNGRADITIDRRVPSFGASRRFVPDELLRYSGAMEHLHVPTTTKIDAGGLLIDALYDAGGWRR